MAHGHVAHAGWLAPAPRALGTHARAGMMARLCVRALCSGAALAAAMTLATAATVKNGERGRSEDEGAPMANLAGLGAVRGALGRTDTWTGRLRLHLHGSPPRPAQPPHTNTTAPRATWSTAPRTTCHRKPQFLCE